MNEISKCIAFLLSFCSYRRNVKTLIVLTTINGKLLNAIYCNFSNSLKHFRPMLIPYKDICRLRFIMADQQRFAVVTSFKGTIQQLKTHFRLLDEKTLTISVEDNPKLELYISIDKDYISKQDQFFKSVFQEPQDVLEYLFDNFSHIILEDNSLKFPYNYGANSKKTKDIVIQLSKKEQDNQNIQMKESKDSQWLERDRKVQQLEKQYALLSQQSQEKCQQITKKVQQLQDVIRQHEEENAFLKIELQLIQQKIEALQEIKVRLQQQQQRNKDVAEEIKTYQTLTRQKFKLIDIQMKKMEKNSRSMNQQVETYYLKSEGIIRQLKESCGHRSQQRESITRHISHIDSNIQKELANSTERMASFNAIKVRVEENSKIYMELKNSLINNQKLSSSAFAELQAKLLDEQNKIVFLQSQLQSVSQRAKAIQIIKASMQHKAKTNAQMETVLLKSKSLVVSVQKVKQVHQSHHELLRRINNIGAHPFNPHNKYFIVSTIAGTSARLQRIGQHGWYNFINKFEIFPNQTVKYSLRLSKITNNGIIFGFCTENAFGNARNFENKQSAYYSCYNQIFHEGGVVKPIIVPSFQGKVVDCIANCQNNSFVWSLSGVKLVQSSIPIQMKNRSIYFSILLNYKNDQVDLLI